MTMSINEPTDQELVSKLPWWIRNVREYINTLEASIPTGSFISITELSITPASINIAVGVELSTSMFEIIFVSGGPATIANIYSGTQGQLKIFIFLNNAISFTDGAQLSDEIYLNQLPVGTDFNPVLGDIITLVNVNGDGSAGSGYCKEVYRQIGVK